VSKFEKCPNRIDKFCPGGLKSVDEIADEICQELNSVEQYVNPNSVILIGMEDQFREIGIIYDTEEPGVIIQMKGIEMAGLNPEPTQEETPVQYLLELVKALLAGEEPDINEEQLEAANEWLQVQL